MRSLVAWRLLLHDRSSTAGSLLGVVAIVFLVSQQLSIYFGLLNYMSVLVDHSGADVWVMSSRVTNVDAGGLVSVRYWDRLAGLPEVAWVEPLLIGTGLFRKQDGSFEQVRVVGLRQPRLAGGPWAFFQGDQRTLLDAENITVDRLDLDKLGDPEIQSVSEIGGQRVRVGAVNQGARGFLGTLVFGNIQKVRDIAGTPPGRYSALLVKFKPGVNQALAVQRLQALVPNLSVVTSPELSRMTRQYYEANTGIGGSFGFSTSVAVLVGVVIIMLTMYASVLNRERDFAVMRALGARRWDIVVLVISQTLIISLFGILLGFFLLALFLNLVRGSTIPSYMPAMIPPVHAGLTVLCSLLGSLLALRKALKAEPASVFH
ncbi:MAG: ABC transporter permease [Desulfobaccales bacterium]